MAQFYKVTKAFQSTDKETKQPVLDEHGNGTWLFQVEGQTAPGWMKLRRKQGSVLKGGDQVYGILDTWDDGKAKFVRQQPPQDAPRPAPQSAPAQTTTGGSVDSKLDYIISLLENRANFQGSPAGTQGNTDVVLTDIDDGPVDLSNLDY